MASVHAAHARRGDRVTSWWRGTSLRAKVTGVTVAVLAVGLLGRMAEFRLAARFSALAVGLLFVVYGILKL